MKLYVARHGETAWNDQNKIIGRTDMPLNETGGKQAERLGEEMRGKGVAAIYTSPLLRAKQTAEAIAKTTGAPVVEDERLVEQNFGAFEGTSRLAKEYLDAKMQFAVRLPGGGESVMDMAARVYALLEELRGRHADETVFLATHNSVMRVVQSYFQDIPPAEYRTLTFPNAVAVLYGL